MHFLSTLLVLSLPFTALASGKAKSLRMRQEARNLEARNNTGSRTFKLSHTYQGKNFFDDWEFFTGPDPTHGLVNFQSQQDAFSKGLAYVQADNTTFLKVDDTTQLQPGQNRDSIRINTKRTYNGGLFIFDAFAMPHGCSVWPAWWSVGPNWPQGGEIDITEGVNGQAVNQYTLHTSEGCNMQSLVQPSKRTAPNSKRDYLKEKREARLESRAQAFTGKLLGTQCAFINGDNTGCAFTDTDARSYGESFNRNAGGVYAHLWDNTGVKAWFFARGEIPEDIDAGNPDPSTWGTPAAAFSSQNCDMTDHFFEHQLVIDTTLCGDWAGGVFNQMGCQGTCAETVANPDNFKFAHWAINYIAIYQ